MSPAELYAAMVAYAEGHGLRRVDPGSGWWWSANLGEEMTLGPAVEELLHMDGIDTRDAVAGELDGEFRG